MKRPGRHNIVLVNSKCAINHRPNDSGPEKNSKSVKKMSLKGFSTVQIFIIPVALTLSPPGMLSLDLDINIFMVIAISSYN